MHVHLQLGPAPSCVRAPVNTRACQVQWFYLFLPPPYQTSDQIQLWFEEGGLTQKVRKKPSSDGGFLQGCLSNCFTQLQANHSKAPLRSAGQRCATLWKTRPTAKLNPWVRGAACEKPAAAARATCTKHRASRGPQESFGPTNVCHACRLNKAACTAHACPPSRSVKNRASTPLLTATAAAAGNMLLWQGPLPSEELRCATYQPPHTPQKARQPLTRAQQLPRRHRKAASSSRHAGIKKSAFICRHCGQGTKGWKHPIAQVAIEACIFHAVLYCLNRLCKHMTVCSRVSYHMFSQQVAVRPMQFLFTCAAVVHMRSC